MKDLKWSHCHDASRPYRPETNGVAERAVRKVKEGTSCLLTQSGLSNLWWSDAMICFCFLSNVMTVLKDEKTPYQKRFDTKFKGSIIPFGAELKFKPYSPKDKDTVLTVGQDVIWCICWLLSASRWFLEWGCASS